MCLINFLVTCTFYVISPFYPPLAKSIGLSQISIGAIFAVESFSSFLSSLLLGKMIGFWGRKKFFLLAMISMIVGLLLFASLKWIDNLWIFILLSVISRLIQGLGASSSYQIIYAQTAIMFEEEDIAKYIGISEICGQSGGSISPAIGSGLFALGGYQLPFLFLGFLLFIGLILLIKIFPVDETLDENQTPPLKLTIFLKHSNVLKIYFLIALSAVGFTFIDPTLALYLQKTYFLKEKEIGLIFVLFSLGYVSPLLCLQFVPKSISNRFWITIGFFIVCISFFLLSPESLIFPIKIYYTCIGLYFLGLGIGFVFIPAIPELIKIGLGIQEQEKELVKDIASGLWNSAFQLGNFSGPLFSSLIIDKFSFQIFSRYFGIICLIYFILFLLNMKKNWHCYSKDKLQRSLINQSEEILNVQINSSNN